MKVLSQKRLEVNHWILGAEERTITWKRGKFSLFKTREVNNPSNWRGRRL